MDWGVYRMIMHLIQGDCLKVLPKLPDECVDLIVTDPPYNISKNDKIVRKGGKFGFAKDINLNFGVWDFGKIKPEDYIPEFVRLLKPCGVLVMFYDKLWLGVIGLWLENEFKFNVRHVGSWIKSNPTPQARKVKWQNGVENFIIATKNHGTGHHYNYKLGQSPDYFITSVNYEHMHPTQKPLDLIKWIINYWSFKGDVVLDPFLGSGTTMKACLELNRSCIGIEIEPKYIQITKERLNWGSSLNPDIEWKFHTEDEIFENSTIFKYENPNMLK